MKDEDFIEAVGWGCTDCRFYDVHWADNESSRGVCHRYPPTWVSLDEEEAAFPRVSGSDYCGEFELSPQARTAWEAERNERLQGRLK